MRAGCGYGDDTDGAGAGIGLFLDDEGGYTSVAVAVALLVSLALVFSAATAAWTLGRSADVQRVADATAMAGENSVAAFCTIAQVLDACVLSMGLMGTLVSGAGLVVACIPGARSLGAKVVDCGKKVLDARKSFARSCMQGLEKLEKTLPYLVVVNSAACVSANATSDISYVGVAIPYPQESMSDYSSLEDDLDAEKMAETAEELREATERAEAAKKLAEAARERGWRADCVDDPSCLRSRASSLAGLAGGLNPDYSAASLWNFGVPITRSRHYYSSRYSQESPRGGGIEELTDSRVRERFYWYALERMHGAYFREHADHTVDLDLPSLPHNTTEVRSTSLYTEVTWPCTAEDESVVLHSDLGCPGATGPYVGDGSLAQLEAGQLGLCAHCGMSVGDMGKVASISTSATNGYEHYWRIEVEASEEYRQARQEQAEAEREMKELGEEGSSLFEKAIKQLSVSRPRLCPPGAWGCVAVVGRSAIMSTPAELTNAFLAGSDLPAGVAISAAALAPDEDTDGNDVLSRIFDGITSRGGFSVGGLLGSVTSIWGRLLVSYGSAYETVSGAAEDFLGKIDGVFGGTMGSWLSGRLQDIVDRVGFAPSDMRLRKPVLVSTEDVLDRAGEDQLARARSLIQSLPDHGSPKEIAGAMGVWVYDQIKDERFTIAELTIPGTEITIPLTIDLKTLMGEI